MGSRRCGSVRDWLAVVRRVREVIRHIECETRTGDRKERGVIEERRFKEGGIVCDHLPAPTPPAPP